MNTNDPAYDAGFDRVEWRPASPSSEDLAKYGAAYWDDFRENCIGIGIVATL